MYKSVCPVYMAYLDKVNKQEQEFDQILEVYRHTHKLSLEEALHQMIKLSNQSVSRNYYRKLLEKIIY
jgi:hypothetical protein